MINYISKTLKFLNSHYHYTYLAESDSVALNQIKKLPLVGFV